MVSRQSLVVTFIRGFSVLLESFLSEDLYSVTLGVLSRCSTHSQINAIYKINITHFLNNRFHFTNYPPYRSAKCFSIHVQHKNSTLISPVFPFVLYIPSDAVTVSLCYKDKLQTKWRHIQVVVFWDYSVNNRNALLAKAEIGGRQ